MKNPRVGTAIDDGVLVAVVIKNGGRNGNQNVVRLFLLNAAVDLFAVDANIGRGVDADLNAAGANAYDREFDAIADDDGFAGPTC
jgi:hypothetical protein